MATSKIVSLADLSEFKQKLTTKNRLWAGVEFPNPSTKMTLSQALNTLTTGIVIVWGRFDGSSVSYKDMQLTFVPSNWFDKYGTYHITTTFASADFSKVAVKEFYFTSNTQITGGSNNDAGGNASGITYDNSAWVAVGIFAV